MESELVLMNHTGPGSLNTHSSRSTLRVCPLPLPESLSHKPRPPARSLSFLFLRLCIPQKCSQTDLAQLRKEVWPVMSSIARVYFFPHCLSLIWTDTPNTCTCVHTPVYAAAGRQVNINKELFYRKNL